MNFGFMKECELESEELQQMYDDICTELEKAERCYFGNPQECGIMLRKTAEKICRIYNLYYEVGFSKETSLEEFLCYTDGETHNAMVSRFLSVVRKEQRDRLNKLRVLGDDCIWGENAPDQGMTLEDRMSLNVKRMMDAMMETLKDMCKKINKRDDVADKVFSEEELLECAKETEKQSEPLQNPETEKRKSWFARIFLDS